jgi:hypothetical protein
LSNGLKHAKEIGEALGEAAKWSLFHRRRCRELQIAI